MVARSAFEQMLAMRRHGVSGGGAALLTEAHASAIVATDPVHRTETVCAR
jgi:hypothetical protein